MKQVNLMHIFLLAPMLIYIGSRSKKQLENNNNKLIDIIFNFILGYSLMIPFVVRNKFFNKNYKEWNNRNFINFLHYLVFIFLFYKIGSSGRNINKIYKYISLLIGLSLIGIHGYFLIKKTT